jgi:dihydrofolate reductase/uncharacterized protein YndB with AHSA1/START domain
VDAVRGEVVADMTISLDGFVAGEGVDPSRPLGEGGEHLIWYGDDVNDPVGALSSMHDDADAAVLEESRSREGAVIMGRTTFDVSIDAWGADPPIHKPCFVLTHRPTETLVRRGDTTFTFVPDPWEALRQARRAAGGRGVGIMGGAATVRQYVMAGLVDELHLHIVPVLLSSGVRLFEHVGPELVRFDRVRVRQGAKAAHLLYRSAGRVDRASKLIAAAPDEVYGACTDAAALQRWLPPHDMTGAMLHFDFRVGGSYRMRLIYAEADRGRGKTTDDADEVEVRLMAIEPGRAIHQEVDFASDDGRFSGVMRMVWTFRPRPEGTFVTVRAEDVPVGIVPEDHVQGLHASLEGLARFVEARARD